MEIISYISATDGFTHYIINNSLGVPFELWLLLMGGSIGLIYILFKKIVG